MMYGYARVSTDAQDTALQVSALKRAGCRRVVAENVSGAVARPALLGLVQSLKPGDVLAVHKVDRLARSLVHLLELVRLVDSRGAALRSLTEPFDTGTPVGRLMLQLLGAFAEWERSMIRERCELGRSDARRRGVRFGRPRSFDYAEAARLRAQGLPLAEVARLVGVRCADTVGSALRGMRRET